MNKKILSLFLAFVLICCTSVCFASDNGSTMQNFANNTDSTLENIGNGMRNVASDVRDGVQDMFDGDDSNNGDHSMMGGTGMGTTGGYTATRTGTDAGAGGAGTGMTNTAWVWLILGITGVVIVALTWYYVTQDTSHRR